MDLYRIARPPLMVAADLSVSKVVRLMVKYAAGAVVIADSSGYVQGIFTERDNLVRVTNANLDPQITPVGDVMTTTVKTVGAHFSADDAMDLMMQRRFRHLPVTDSSNRVIGIVSLRFLLTQRMSEQRDSIEVLEAYVNAGGPG